MLLSMAGPAGADPGFKTTAEPMLTPLVGGSTVKTLISVGDQIGGYTFESIPDGIAIDPRGTSRFDVYVNHELSLVPFPFVPYSAGPPEAFPTTANSSGDFTNSILSRLVMNRGSGKILSGTYEIPSSANYQRFCSNFFAIGDEAGFEFPILFTNEEATDTVNRLGTAYPLSLGSMPQQAGVVVAYRPDIDQYRTILGMGRHNHENSVAIPGYGYPVVLSGDDTFSAPASQLYMYRAANATGVWDDTGDLYAFKPSVANAAINDYGDLAPGVTISGEFLLVPPAIADGDQSGLESWSNANNVFQFIRVEDIAYDRNQPNVVYFADTGEPRALTDAQWVALNPAVNTPNGYLHRGPSGAASTGFFPNGRIFKMVLDPSDPNHVLSLEVLIDGDAGGTSANWGVLGLLHNPDNIETTANSLLIQEDPGSHNHYDVGTGTGTTARVWRYDLETQTLTVVAAVDQSSDTAVPAAKWGAWESSGIVDASAIFGPGTFLVTVQAHSLVIASSTTGAPDLSGPGNAPNGLSDWLLKREGGQLLLLRIPGA